MATFGPEEFKTKTGKRVTFRHCEATDIGAFLAFQPKVASETTKTLQVVGKVPELTKIRDAWESNRKDAAALRLGAFVDGRMVAQLGFSREGQIPHPWTEHIGRFGMMVLKEFWGEGLGRRMLEIMEAHARMVGITRIEALVRTKNERGVRLYTRAGYEIEGTRRAAARINDENHDEYFIAKILNTGSSWRPPVLQTQRLVLKSLEFENAADVFEYARNPNVSRYTLWEPHASIKDSESFILDYALPNYREQVPEPWAITLKSMPSKVIGTVGCFWVSKEAKSMELAYAVGEPYWGQGLVAEASRAVVDHVFEAFNLVRVQARCKVENEASAKVMVKLGMKHEGTLRSAIFHRNRNWDMHYYAVLRDEWVR